MDSIDFVMMRGGTSKGIFLRAGDVPEDRTALSMLLLDIFGSPDRRQIDGLGGADKLTSKAAIIGRADGREADVTYLFGQVGIATSEVEYNLNCGNLTAAVGLYALQEGIVPVGEGTMPVRIHNLNTDRIIVAHVPCSGGRPTGDGDLEIAGVPGRGAPIALDFSAASGALTGKLLPMGEPASIIEAEGLPPTRVSVVDCANLVVFVAAADVGLEGNETPEAIDGNAQALARIDAVRQTVAQSVGIGDYYASRAAPASPICVLVSPPKSYRRFTDGGTVDASEIDATLRIYANGATSRAYAATVGACTGVAARLPGSVLHRAMRRTADALPWIRIGHPAGVMPVESAVTAKADGFDVERATILRTARRIADGRTYLRAPASMARTAR